MAEIASSETATSVELVQSTGRASRTVRRRSVYTTYCFNTEIIESEEMNLIPLMKAIDSPAYYGPCALPHGALSLRIQGMIQVDMTIDNGIWVTNFANNIMMTVDANKEACAMMHPCGRVFQYDDNRVEVLAHDFQGNDKYAMLRGDEILFTSYDCALVYLLDRDGLHTTFGTDYECCDLSMNFATYLFYRGSRRGPECFEQAENIVRQVIHFTNDDGTMHWLVNGIHITQVLDGLVSISDYSTFQMMVSLSNGSAALTTRHVKCMASIDEEPHLFVRYREGKAQFDGHHFILTTHEQTAMFGMDDVIKMC